MEISARNDAAFEIEIQGLPDGTIELVGVPVLLENATVRARIMSKIRKGIIRRDVALRILEGCLKSNDEDYDMNLLVDDVGVVTEGEINFIPPKPGIFSAMTMHITFGASGEDVEAVLDDEARAPTDVVEIQDQLQDEALDDLRETAEDSAGVSSLVLEDEELRVEIEENKTLEKSLEYNIEISFQEFLIAMVKAL